MFIHEKDCPRRRCNGRLPGVAGHAPSAVRAYTAEHAIHYAHNRLVETGRDPPEAAMRETLAQPGVAYIHVRNAIPGCFSFRAEARQRRPAAGAASR